MRVTSCGRTAAPGPSLILTSWRRVNTVVRSIGRAIDETAPGGEDGFTLPSAAPVSESESNWSGFRSTHGGQMVHTADDAHHVEIDPAGGSKQTSWVDWTLGIARRLESSQDHQFNCSPTPEIFGLNLGQVRSPPLPAGWQALWGRSACRGPLLDLEIYFWIKPRATGSVNRNSKTGRNKKHVDFPYFYS